MANSFVSTKMLLCQDTFCSENGGYFLHYTTVNDKGCLRRVCKELCIFAICILCCCFLKSVPANAGNECAVFGLLI